MAVSNVKLGVFYPSFTFSERCLRELFTEHHDFSRSLVSNLVYLGIRCTPSKEYERISIFMCSG